LLESPGLRDSIRRWFLIYCLKLTTPDQGDSGPVLQTALEIPEDVFLGLLAGMYVRDGGVVRDLSGRLVKRRRSVDEVLPACVVSYNASLVAYLEAARIGKLDAGLTERLVADLDALVDHAD
jgi:hypothetical protein